jgi:hypothetical protein
MTFAKEHIVPIPPYSESDEDNSGKWCTCASRRVDDRRWIMFERPIRVRGARPVSHSVITRPARLPTSIIDLDESSRADAAIGAGSSVP